jgi:DNA-binding MarR family transcriptional regulator
MRMLTVDVAHHRVAVGAVRAVNARRVMHNEASWFRAEPLHLWATMASSRPVSADDSDALKLENQLCVPLYVASRLVTQAYRPHLERLGLTYPQYVVLLVLWETDGATVSEIGERLSLDSGTLTPVLKRLVAADLVAQQRMAGDGRWVRNYLTARGRALKAEVASLPADLVCDVGLDIDDVVELRQRLAGLIAKLDRHLSRDRQ